MKKTFVIILLAIISFATFSQESIVNWKIEQSREETGSYLLNISAEIPYGWYIYGMNMDEGGPLPLFISFEDAENKIITSEFTEISIANKMYDEVFGMDVNSYTKKVEIKCMFVPKRETEKITLIIDGQACNKKDGSCIQVYETIPLEILK
jgi:hypothetical protein